ncbi:transcriptional regulator [Pseudomonas nicosulfuronedens]|uniref:Transcriptional regulator n=1 Tax=Pseudomonas nicosulfuronedens TaxID=2571105 RepID=A0A5R9R707_9PSED|nr:transcriptional regulator [Pseudomonas nicosulfuronedens]TLX78638.1 transcriptional regulator [Pseudomonas nicosulfuronedens]
MHFRPAVAALAFGCLPFFAFADEVSEKTRDEMKRHQEEIKTQLSDVEYNRRRVVERNIQLAPAEAEAFWGIYNIYRAEADKVDTDALALSLDFVRSLERGSVGEEQARDLQKRVFDLEDRRQQLKETYVTRVAKEVSPVRALRFLQIESQLDALALIQTNRSLPLAE